MLSPEVTHQTFVDRIQCPPSKARWGANQLSGVRRVQIVGNALTPGEPILLLTSVDSIVHGHHSEAKRGGFTAKQPGQSPEKVKLRRHQKRKKMFIFNGLQERHIPSSGIGTDDSSGAI
jgi:hypothetical protein